MSQSSNPAAPTRTNVSSSGANELDPNSHTAQRLKHGTAEHLHLTTRRFFIGPIPEGWLNSNRKSWFKRRIALNNFSSREAKFDAATEQRHRKVSSLTAEPSLAARMQFSFSQPEDVNSRSGTSTVDGSADNDRENHDNIDEEEDEDEDEEIETTNLVPVSTDDAGQLLSTSNTEDASRPKMVNIPSNVGVNGAGSYSREQSPSGSRQMSESWKTAQEDYPIVSVSAAPINQDGPYDDQYNDINGRAGTSTIRTEDSRLHVDDIGPDDIDSSSRTALLTPERPHFGDRVASSQDRIAAKNADSSMAHHDPTPVDGLASTRAGTQKAPGVRFKVAEGIADRRQRFGRKAGTTKNRVTSRVSRRSTLRDGMVIKMERMLVRVDVTMQQLSDIFDENESIKTEARSIDSWREYMVVARKSTKQDDEDFRLQMYDTRVIPEIDGEQTKKKPTREVKLLPHSTHVNLYSSLDKTVVIWHPYRKGTRILIMKPSSTAHAVEWYTFLRDALGAQRPKNLQVNVPDLDVAIHIERPFDDMKATGTQNVDSQTLLAKAAEAEKAVAGKIVAQSMEILSRDPEWSQILQKWTETTKMGLAWKRYDRLEWVQGTAEQKMYGSMAMQHSHDLELRPKQHYPTHAYGRKGVQHEEPAPVEGFLIRLTSQKGVHKRWGKAFYKRLYFATHDKYLVFNRPAKAIPPHPPRLATLGGDNVPSAQEIVRETPMMYEILPYENADGDIKWLKPGQTAHVGQSNAEAIEESNRVLENLTASDGYINMTRIIKVRKLVWGASEVDEALDSGSDVDWHEDVENSRHDDGTTTDIDDDRTFELVLDNNLVIRLQAYSKETRNEWMQRLRQLIKYWKLRWSADIMNLKATRTANLKGLNIDEDQEAQIGQFAHKWEVSRSEANPELWNFCRVAGCRTITMSGMLYRKPRRHSTFQRCSVLLAGGQMLIYQAMARKTTGEQISHIHQDKQLIVDLKDCYVYSGLIVEDDLLYQNRTFDANHAGMLASTPRVYLNDNWTTSDVDVMTCFVVWMNRRKGWFKSVAAATTSNDEDRDNKSKGERRSKLRRVAQLGVPGRGMVFKCRSRAERDLWVTSVATEIQTAVEKELYEMGKGAGEDLADVRLEG